MSGNSIQNKIARAPRSRRAGDFRCIVWRPAFSFCCLLVASGCYKPVTSDTDVKLQALERTLAERELALERSEQALTALRRDLAQARGFDAEGADVFAPTRIVIDRLSGGQDYDRAPGDDGVTVYLRPLDQFDDTIKIAGSIHAQLFDLQAPEGARLVGEVRLAPVEAAERWQGKLMTNHYTLKIPWAPRPPANPEITIRVSFTDAIWKRTLTAQDVRTVELPGASTAVSP